QVDAERLVRHVLGLLDLLDQGLGRARCERCQEAQRAGIRHCGDQLGLADAGHPATGDRDVDSEHLGKARFDHLRGSFLVLWPQACRVFARGGRGGAATEIGPECRYPTNGSRTMMVSSRSGLVESRATGAPISSSIRRTYLIALAGRSAQLRAPRVELFQPS